MTMPQRDWWAPVRWFWWGVVLLATVELSARVDDWARWRAPLTTEYSADLLVRQQDGLVRGRAGYRYEKWAMNSLGFRGPDLGAKPQGVQRIAVLGASETFGLFESPGYDYPAQLDSVLAAVAPGAFEVVNVALPGMSLSAMPSYVRRAVAPVVPDIVVLYPSPTFYLATELPPSPTASRRVPPAAPSWSLGRAVRALRITTKAKNLAKRLIPVRIQVAVRHWRLDNARRGRPDGWTWETVPDDRLDAYEEHLRAVMASVVGIGARPVLVTHTNRFLGRPWSRTDLGDYQHLLAVISNYFPRASEPVMVGVDSAANRRTRAVARDFGALLVEAEGKMPPDATTFADYSHFTDAGARRMAELVATAVVAMPGAPRDPQM